MPDNGSTLDRISRRKMVAALGAVSTASLAGCAGDDGEAGLDDLSDSELGERVPELTLQYWSDIGGPSENYENILGVIIPNIEEALGVDASANPAEFSASSSQMFNDERDMEFHVWSYTAAPERIDPAEMLQRATIEWAGANGLGNEYNYASCEYSDGVREAERADSEEERFELLQEAIKIRSEDCIQITLTGNPNFGAYYPDQVELEVGQIGIIRSNSWAFGNIQSDNEDVSVGCEPGMFQTLNFLTSNQGFPETTWNQVFHSPLLQFNPDMEIQNVLAEEVESVGPREFHVTLRDDAVFHNGDPITAEDVQFTFEQLRRGADEGAYPRVTTPEMEMEIVDDLTIEFHLEENYWPFLITELSRWGILHEDTWEEAGAVDNPNEADFDADSLVGSGPYELTDFQSGQFAYGSVFEDHPVHSPDTDLIWVGYSTEEAQSQALEADEIQVAPELTAGTMERITDENEDIIGESRDEFIPYQLNAYHPVAPSKFEEFRKAVAACLNRREANAIAWRGEGEEQLVSSPFSTDYEFAPDADELYQMTDDPEGDYDQARDILVEAGWGWENNELHYPQDADLEPLWPLGEEPSPDDFPCL